MVQEGPQASNGLLYCKKKKVEANKVISADVYGGGKPGLFTQTQHPHPHPRHREKSRSGRLTQKSGVGSQAQLLSGSPIKLSLFHGVGLKGKEYTADLTYNLVSHVKEKYRYVHEITHRYVYCSSNCPYKLPF